MTELFAVKEAPDTLLMDEVFTQAPNFLIEWEPRWAAFSSSLGPAMQKSSRQLRGECNPGLFPGYRILIAWALEVVLLIAAISIPSALQRMQPYTPLTRPKYDVIYYSGDYLPQTTDTGGTHAGHTGRAGGRHAKHPTQVIKVARGDAQTEKVVDAPKLKLPRSDDAVANLIAVAAAKPGPPPTEGLRPLSKPKLLLPEDAIAPTPEVSRQKLQKMALMDVSAVPPQPEVTRDKLAKAPLMDTTVVHPAPEVMRDKLAKTAMPETTVVHPAPTGIAREKVKLPEIKDNVVPPPVSAPVRESQLQAKLSLPPPTVVQPPPSSTNLAHEIWGMAGSLFGGGKKDVVPPPVDAQGGSLGKTSSPAMSFGGDREGAVVPPPPDLAGGTAHGSKSGNAMAGLGASPVLAPAGGGNSRSSGVVASSQPGAKLGVPGNAGAGSIAMSPDGNGTAGLGGKGSGAGTGAGAGPGSGKVGEGSGATDTGIGFGANRANNSGISSSPGHGGAGSGGGKTEVAGIAIRGGVVNLPSFSSGGDAPSTPPRTPSERPIHPPAITIVATARSGGALNLYGALKGDKVYTIYIDTHQGIAVLQFAAPPAKGGFDEDLTPPEPEQTELPPELKKSRVLVECNINPSGYLSELKVLQTPGGNVTAKMLEALEGWRFRPALKGQNPIAVQAILGFNIDTK
ncbi:MAG TPA: hypothetical protein VFA76_17365 [Terriglobales bacterium]|nr:hypothetical protein [Terriglobales bacterium]